MKHCLYFVYTCKELMDGTGNGLSSKVTSGILFWDCTKEEAMKWCAEKNVPADKQFYLVPRELWGENHCYAEPLVRPVPDSFVQSFGGNYLITSNGAAYNHGYCRTSLPIPIHDRFDVYEDYLGLAQ